MRPSHIARGIAVGRIAIGIALVVVPERPLRPWVGKDAKRPRAQVLARSLGARDALLGAGTLIAPEGDALRMWAAASALADVADLVAVLAARDELPKRALRLVAPLAGGSAAAGAVAAVLAR